MSDHLFQAAIVAGFVVFVGIPTAILCVLCAIAIECDPVEPGA